jgi:hypothetical protein
MPQIAIMNTFSEVSSFYLVIKRVPGNTGRDREGALKILPLILILSRKGREFYPSF